MKTPNLTCVAPLLGSAWLTLAVLAAAPTGAWAGTHYFADCQDGAAPNCVPGNNANAGTSAAAPKRTLDGFNVNALPAGSRLRFKRGGAWANFHIVPLDNRNATPDQPLVFDAYGSGAKPLFKTPSGNAIEFGEWQNTAYDGGYVLRNLRFDGNPGASWALWLRDNLHHLTLDKVEITGFDIAIHSQPSPPSGIHHITLRNSKIAYNRSMGILGQFSDSLFEGNTFERNNFSGSTFNHAIYFSGNANGGRNNVLRGNHFLYNSTVDGVCTGGNVTFHGQMDGMLIEKNLIKQAQSTGGCYGFSINPGYDSAEWFRHFVLRGNKVVNLGNCSFCISSAPDIVVEGNLSVVNHANYHAAVSIGGGTPAPGDAADTGAIVRNNKACFPTAAPNQFGDVVDSPGGEVSGNTVFRGSDATPENCKR